MTGGGARALRGRRSAWLAAALALEAGSVVAFIAAFRGVFCPWMAWRLSYQTPGTAPPALTLGPAALAAATALAVAYEAPVA